MWWGIGIGALVIVAFLFSKFRTVSNQTQMVQAGQSHLRAAFTTFAPSATLMDKEVDGRVWSDPYLLGYALGSVSIVMESFRRPLNAVQKGMVIIRILDELAGSRRKEVCERIETLSGSKDAEFVRGVTHGSNVVTLISNRAGPELLAEPDVQMALREAPAYARFAEENFGPTDMGQSSVAGEVLMQHYMERHKREVADLPDYA